MREKQIMKVVTADRQLVAIITRMPDGAITCQFLDPVFQPDLETLITFCQAYGIPLRKQKPAAAETGGNVIEVSVEHLGPDDERFFPALRDEIGYFQFAGQNLFGLIIQAQTRE